MNTILVIDDEASIRLALKAILDRRFKVVVFADGLEALDYVARQPREVSAAFVDHGIPGKDGNEICGELRLIDSSISLIGITGSELAVFTFPLFACVHKKQLGPTQTLALAESAAEASRILRDRGPDKHSSGGDGP